MGVARAGSPGVPCPSHNSLVPIPEILLITKKNSLTIVTIIALKFGDVLIPQWHSV